MSVGERGSTFTDVATFQVAGHPILEAAWNGKMKLLKTLVEGGTDPNYTNGEGQSALMALCARQWGENLQYAIPLIQYLLTKPVDLNLQDKFGKTALIYACAINQDPRLISMLIEAGANLFTEDRLGFTPLVYAYNFNNDDLKKVLSVHCKSEGREMVLLETRLDRNFLSYLKIQKRLGVEQNSVLIGGKDPLSPPKNKGHIYGVPDSLSKMFSRPSTPENRKMSAQCPLDEDRHRSSGGSRLANSLRRFSASNLPQRSHGKTSVDYGNYLHPEPSIQVAGPQTLGPPGSDKVADKGVQCALIGSATIDEEENCIPPVYPTADVVETLPELMFEDSDTG